MPDTSLRLRSWGPVVAVPVLALLQAISPAPAVMLALLILVGLLISSYFWAQVIRRRIRMQRQASRDWAAVGEAVVERFQLQNRTWLPVPWIELRDLSDLPGYQISRALVLKAHGQAQWTTHGIGRQRGIYNLGPSEVRLGDPFGLFEVTLRYNDARTFYVYPAVTPLPSFAQWRTTTRGAARPNVRALERTIHAVGARPYVQGDPFHHIHWRSTAHRSTPGRDQILIKEFDPEPLVDYWLVLDLQAAVQAGEGPASTEEYGVSLAASLAYQLLQGRRAVGLIAYGAEPVIVPPQKGMPQLWEILRALAGVRADGVTPLDEVLAQSDPLVKHGMACALITPSGNPRWLEALPRLMGRSVHVVAWLLHGPSFGPPTHPLTDEGLPLEALVMPIEAGNNGHDGNGANGHGAAPNRNALTALADLGPGDVYGLAAALSGLGIAGHVVEKGMLVEHPQPLVSLEP